MAETKTSPLATTTQVTTADLGSPTTVSQTPSPSQALYAPGGPAPRGTQPEEVEYRPDHYHHHQRHQHKVADQQLYAQVAHSIRSHRSAS